jgi:Predicted metal-dependent hydrolase with the TIM-barrel fold
MKYCWPFESLRKGGAVLAFGTDYPVVDISPFRGIYRAVTRMTNEGEPKGGWNPAERVSVHEALRAYTFCGAYAAGRDEELGTLEAGKLADVIVVDKNLFDYAEDREAMFDMQVLLTMVNGQIVHEK